MGPLLVISICVLVIVLVLAGESHSAFALRRFRRRSPRSSVISGDDGICASRVLVYGYKCQELHVTTEDGYILSLQRIPEGRAELNQTGTKKQPVILQHGVFTDGITWLVNPPEESLPFIMADNGFDVWISNGRGTRFSQAHTSLDPSSSEYWNWSWDELASYDLPAVFDYVFNQTGQKSHYVGHSQGTLIALVSFSERRLLNRVKSAALLSPIAYLSHMTTKLGNFAARFFLGEITRLLGLAELDPKGLVAAGLLRYLCTRSGVDCYNLLSAFTGPNCCLNSSTVDLAVKNEPQPTSTKNLIHFSQTVRDGIVAKYNYVNPEDNMMHYGQEFPPIYNLSNIPQNLPLFLSYGEKDALSDVLDVAHLLEDLKSHDVHKLKVQKIKNYAHADFIFGVNAKSIVYNDVIAFFRRHRSA